MNWFKNKFPSYDQGYLDLEQIAQRTFEFKYPESNHRGRGLEDFLSNAHRNGTSSNRDILKAVSDFEEAMGVSQNQESYQTFDFAKKYQSLGIEPLEVVTRAMRTVNGLVQDLRIDEDGKQVIKEMLNNVDIIVYYGENIGSTAVLTKFIALNARQALVDAYRLRDRLRVPITTDLVSGLLAFLTAHEAGHVVDTAVAMTSDLRPSSIIDPEETYPVHYYHPSHFYLQKSCNDEQFAGYFGYAVLEAMGFSSEIAEDVNRLPVSTFYAVRKHFTAKKLHHVHELLLRETSKNEGLIRQVNLYEISLHEGIQDEVYLLASDYYLSQAYPFVKEQIEAGITMSLQQPLVG